MKILVSDEKVIAALQQEFHEYFPYLKVEFFQSHGIQNKKAQNKVPGNKTFGSCKAHRHSKHFVISPAMTIVELGKKFQAYYGLLPQIFRQSGKVWLETTLTDNWTLQEQNEQGKALSSPLAE